MMPTYGRNKQIQGKRPEASSSEKVPAQGASATDEKAKPKGIRIDGFQQVVDLLRAADPEFRQSLLRRIMAHDPVLARNLQTDLAKYL